MPNIGIGHAVGFSEESVWGTAAGTTDNWLPTHPGMEAIKQQVELIEGENLQHRGIDAAHLAAGGRMASGPLAHDAKYGGGWLLFLAQICGADPVTAGVGPFTHTQRVGAALGGASDNRDKGITVFVDREGQGAAGTAKAAIYSGGKPTALEMTWEYNARMRLAYEMFFKEHDSWGSLLTPSLPTDGWIIAPSPAGSPTTFLTYNGNTHKCRAATVRIEQEWDQERRDLQSPTVLVPEINGRVKLTGTFQVEAPATAAGSGGPFFDDFVSKTPRAIVLTSEGATPASEALVLTIRKALITSPGEPEVSGPGTVLYNAEWEGYYDSANSEMAQIVLTSSDSAAWT